MKVKAKIQFLGVATVGFSEIGYGFVIYLTPTPILEYGVSVSSSLCFHCLAVTQKRTL